MNPKPIRITLRYLLDGSTFKWSIRRVAKTWLVNPEGCLSRSRYGTGWEYIDHDGYPRFVEGNWQDMLARLRLTVANYGCEIMTAID